MKKIEYICERITNIAELETIINKSYAIAQLIGKEFPESENSKKLTELLKSAYTFEFYIERRKVKEDGGNSVKSIPTKYLVDELSTREGVTKIIAEPYKSVETNVDGPAIILKIID